MKRLHLSIMLAVLVQLPCRASWAEVRPQPIGGDPRVQMASYDPDEIVSLRVASGFVLTIQLSPDERIEAITLGDGSGWQVQATKRGDTVFVRSTGGAAATNLTVLTDSRRYLFTLHATSSDDGSAPLVLRFSYPRAAANPPSVGAATQVFQYRVRGARGLWPTTMYDDGLKTFVEWPEEVSQPAVYRIDEQGRQMLVNGHIEGRRYVIEGVAKAYLFKLGRDQARATRLVPKAKR
ncbi:MAG: TrbG/VirB9 family P-type conjugative transfer protein [Sphingomonas sp.]|nr:TrbG/VirB9 family P-type conjugative transfer protein [Sphingomonas sp.]